MNGQSPINYSAADIERYYKGNMSSKEMHDLEKAALDDPFLADAMEGYVTTPVNQSEDISLLEKKLNEKINNKKKVLPFYASEFSWLRIAALFILMGGAGLVTYQYVIKRKTNDVAKTENNDISKARQAATDSPQTAPVIFENKTDSTNSPKTEALTDSKATHKRGNIAREKEESITAQKDSAANDKADSINQPEQIVSAAPKAEEKKNVVQNETLKKSNPASSRTVNVKQESGKLADGIKDAEDRKEYKSKQVNEAEVTRNFSQTTANVFRGRVLDENNSPLPFANVTNIRDKVGTYTDAKGYFTLLSPDSSLNVQVHSVGFENNVAQLKNNITSNTVVLQPDTKNIASTTLSNRKVNTERKREDNMVLEEPEPSDGWYNYDTYLANNITIPDEIKAKKTYSGEVELSFTINKNGEPVDIKIEKSVCKECDTEAIRLLKDGPKWKKKKKNARAKVAIAF